MGQGLDDLIRATPGRIPDVFESNKNARCLSRDFPSTPGNLYEQYRRALNLVRDSVVALDPEGRIVYLNRAAEELFESTRGNVIGRDARTTLFAETRVAFDAAWLEVSKHGEWCGSIALKSGVERLVETRWSAVYDEQSSKLESVLIAGTEISTLHLLAAGLAHEIRNPLAGIKGVADAFLQRRQLTSQERQWLEAVQYEVMKIDVRMRELLDVSQPRVFSVEQCSLRELIDRAVLLARHQLPPATHHGEITIECIDLTTEPLVITADSARLEDAVLNLVLNAIESIDETGRVTVLLRRQNCANGDAEAVIEVTDTGCGIPLEVRRRVFEPLFTTKHEGTGLGLAAVQGVAAAYDGRITFRTRTGRGSTFILTLPLRPQPYLTESPK